MSKAWLSDRQICEKKLGGCSRSSLHRYRQQDPDFPQPRRYGGRNLTLETEIDAYFERALAKPDNKAPRDRDRSGRFADQEEVKLVRLETGSGP